MVSILISSLVFCLIQGCLGAATLGDQVLEEREARLKELSNSLSPEKIQSSLQGLENREGKISLLDPAQLAPTLTLAESVRQALKHRKAQNSPDLRRKKAKFQRRLANPMRRFSAKMRTGVNLADNLGNDSRNSFHRHIYDLAHQEDAYYADLRLDYPLLDGGASSARDRIANLQAEILELHEIQKEQALIANVAQTFIEILILEEKLDLAYLRKQKAKEDLLAEERRNSVNSSTALAVLENKIKVQHAEDQVSRLQTRRLFLRQEFSLLVGFSGKPDFKIDKNARTRVVKESLEGLLKEVRSQSPAVRILKLRKKALEHEKAKTLSKRGISLDLFGKTSYARLFDRNGLDEIRYLAGIELGTHLLDGGKTATRLEVNRLDSLLQDLGENQITQETENELRVDFKALQAAKVGIPVRKSHVRLARSLLLDSEADFDRGQIAKAHLLDRRISYRQAVLNYYQALESFMLSKLRLFQTLGRLDVGLFG